MLVFSIRLKEMRKSLNLTQKQVAEGMGVLEQAYQRYEYGKKEPSISKLEKLCRCLDVSADFLLGLSDEPRPIRKDAQNV